MEFIIEFLVLYIFGYPGAFIRWAIGGFKKPFKHYVNGDMYTNGGIGIVFFVLIVVLIKSVL